MWVLLARRIRKRREQKKQEQEAGENERQKSEAKEREAQRDSQHQTKEVPHPHLQIATGLRVLQNGSDAEVAGTATATGQFLAGKRGKVVRRHVRKYWEWRVQWEAA